MDKEQIVGNATRSVCVKDCQVRAVNEEEMTVELSFSSEEPYLRAWGWEVLSHDQEAVDMSRMENSAPLLVQHDMGQQIGVVERAWIEGKRGKALVRFSRNSQQAKEYFGDVRDGIRRNVSVGYQIHDAEVTGVKDGEDVWTVTRWMPFEISIVSVPADNTVGVGRSKTKQETKMEEKKTEKREEQREPVKTVDVEAVRKEAADNARKEARKAEMERAREINAIAAEFDKRDLASSAIERGISVDEFRKEVLESFKTENGVDSNTGFIGMNEKEVREYSLMRALNALANPTNRRAQEAAAYEFEISAEAQRQSGVEAQGILVPFDVMARAVTVGGTGGNLVPTDLAGNAFIELLRNRSAVLQAATILTGLNGNLDIPKQLTASTVQDLTETGTITDSDVTFGKLTLTPRRAGASVPYSKQLLAQSSLDVEMLIRNDIITQIALKIDWNALNGDGSNNMPVGIRHTTGVNLVEIGTDGGAPTWAHFVQMETEIAVDNADVSGMGYLLNAKGRGYVKTTPKVSGQAVFIADGDMINGYSYRVSNQVPSNLTKGTGTGLSNITFGNFADLIVGFWGGVDLIVDPYSLKKDGMVEITADQFYDVGVRRAESFAIIEDAAV